MTGAGLAVERAVVNQVGALSHDITYQQAVAASRLDAARFMGLVEERT